MKKMKKTLALVLALVMALALAIPASASTLTITPQNAYVAHQYEAYQIFKGNLNADQTSITDTAHPIQLNTIDWGSNVNGNALINAIKANDKFKTDDDTYDFANVTDAADVAAVLATYRNNSTKLQAFADVIADTEGVLTGTPKTANAAAAENVVFNDLADGYYFIKDVDESQDVENGSYTKFMLDVVGDTTATAKDSIPTIVKTSENKHITNGSIGDKVPYTVTGSVPNMDGYESYLYQVTDTMSAGLTFNDDVVVKINNTPLAEVAQHTDGKFYPIKTKTVGETTVPDLDNNGDAQPDTTKPAVTAGYTLDRTPDGPNDKTTFKVYIVNFIQYNTEAMKGKTITIDYSATINEDALDTTATTNDGQVNSAKLIYSNNPNESDKGTDNEPKSENPKGEGPDSKVKTYTTALEIQKYDGQNDSKYLAGAVFELTGDAANVVITNGDIFVKYAGTKDEAKAAGLTPYWKLTDGTFSTDDPATPNMDQTKYASTTQIYVKETTVDKTYNAAGVTSEGLATTNDNGIATFVGLGEGQYKIEEITAPVGYNKLEYPIWIQVVFTGTDSATDPSGSYTVYRYTENSTTAPTYSAGDSKWVALVSNGSTFTSDVEFDLSVENNAGSTLPSTGGIGTKIFYALGAVLVVGAGVVLVSRKRVTE